MHKETNRTQIPGPFAHTKDMPGTGTLGDVSPLRHTYTGRTNPEGTHTHSLPLLTALLSLHRKNPILNLKNAGARPSKIS